MNEVLLCFDVVSRRFASATRIVRNRFDAPFRIECVLILTVSTRIQQYQSRGKGEEFIAFKGEMCISRFHEERYFRKEMETNCNLLKYRVTMNNTPCYNPKKLSNTDPCPCVITFLRDVRIAQIMIRDKNSKHM